MFRLPIAGGAELRILEPRHVEELYELTLKHRDHLRAWLPWAHADYTIEDTRAFVQGALNEFVATGAIPAGIWYEEKLVGMIGKILESKNTNTRINYAIPADLLYGFIHEQTADVAVTKPTPATMPRNSSTW